ncbi:hydrolase [Spirochaetia bacterium]|nr:hydrolase [Spirochaetia bacterium]
MNKAEVYSYIQMIRDNSAPLEPLPLLPGSLPAEWETAEFSPTAEFSQTTAEFSPLRLDGIRAVLFDIYGTLFVSGAGDIAAAPGFAIDPSAGQEKLELTQSAEFEAMTNYFRKAVRRFHEEALAAGKTWPEVICEEIWARYSGPIPPEWEQAQKLRNILKRISGAGASGTGASAGPGSGGTVSGRAGSLGREMALRYELALNPVYPMPGAEKTLRALVSRGLVPGIISNAQFYTPLLFNAFFNKPPEELGFDPGLSFYSFAEGEAKPSPGIFAKAREQLALRNIKAEETLYIGNDMRNDIKPAAGAGFRTVLFAGDRRSLRLRREDPGCVNLRPDMVLTGWPAFNKLLQMPDQGR